MYMYYRYRFLRKTFIFLLFFFKDFDIIVIRIVFEGGPTKKIIILNTLVTYTVNCIATYTQ